MARACLVQFEGVKPTEHMWFMVRTSRAIEQVIENIAQYPGLVIFTIVDDGLRQTLVNACRGLQAPCISVLDPLILALGEYLGTSAAGQPGRQHAMDDAYFRRIEALNWSMAHDDGQGLEHIDGADIVLVGVSRTSKTPTSLYLGNQGIRVANVPFIAGQGLPAEVSALNRALVIGLTKDANRLVENRRARLLALRQDATTSYVDLEEVRSEVAEARRQFARHGWTVLDVSRRSIEETAAEILRILDRRREELEAARGGADKID